MELGRGESSGSADVHGESSGRDDTTPPFETNATSRAHHGPTDPLSGEIFIPADIVPPNGTMGTAFGNTGAGNQSSGDESGVRGTDSMDNSGTTTIDNSPDSIVPGGAGPPHPPPHLHLEGGHFGDESQPESQPERHDVLGMPGHFTHPVASWQQTDHSYFPPNLYGQANVGQNESLDRSTQSYPPTHPGPMHLPQGYYVPPPPGYPGYPPLATLNGGYPGVEGRSLVPGGNPFQQVPPNHPYQFPPGTRSHSQPMPGYQHPNPPQGQWSVPQNMPNSMDSYWNSTRGHPANQSFPQQGHHPAPDPTRYQPYPNSRSPARPQDDNENSPSPLENSNDQARRSGHTTRQLRAMQDNKTKVKKHHCDTCPMQFERPSNLKVHQRIHTGARPFICPECEKDFTTASNMTRHRKRIHPEAFSQQISRRAHDNVSHATRQSSNPRGTIRVEHEPRRQMAQQSTYLGETSFQRQTFGRDQSQQYASQGRSGDQSQGTMGDELNSSDHGDDEESEEDDDYESNRRNRRRRGPK